MQTESQALVREWNRRLRLALAHAPNHIRVEAALEVESHVEDVLSTQPDDLPEPEQVARILSGFGTPEAYASAITSQIPEVGDVTLRSGVREVLLAVSDLCRGLWRLILASVLGCTALTINACRKAWRMGCAVYDRARGPSRVSCQWMGELAGCLLEWVRALAAALLRYAGIAIKHLTALMRSTNRLAKWAARVIVITTLTGLALIAFGVAGFSALAPDIVGCFVYEIQTEVAEVLSQMRRSTVDTFQPEVQAAFSPLGAGVMQVATIAGLLMTAMLIFMLWNSWRRRSNTAG